MLVLERNDEFGGAATTYRHRPLTIEGSLHQTSGFGDPVDPKARILAALGILDELEFVPIGAFQEVRGHMFDPPFVLPYGFEAAEACATLLSARPVVDEHSAVPANAATGVGAAHACAGRVLGMGARLPPPNPSASG